MFNFDDIVVYEKSKGKDRTGDSLGYEPPENRKMRIAYDGYEEVTKDGNTARIWKRVYHSPFEVFEDDKTDGFVLKDITVCKVPLIGKVYWRIEVR
ncbi:hypothetical protein [Proteiniborus sp. MB09-C3]|uniref:hypothetical protein n=1 Tax=Proteiniborus sp. MB09-C3 TaxID=3050072 RepID=UPI0025538398|nr:hypothetical protein [Proteiniborus sp. MB09-C3]WIV13202.1 hypothetical protein QO263_05695 [Proteiniborus sp. MB09-C3]